MRRIGAWGYAAGGAFLAAFVVVFVTSGQARAALEYIKAALIVLGN